MSKEDAFCHEFFFDPKTKLIIKVEDHKLNARISIDADGNELSISLLKKDFGKLLVAGFNFLRDGKESLFYYDEFKVEGEEPISAKKAIETLLPL